MNLSKDLKRAELELVEQKLKWIRSLKVGDLVNDCRGKDMKIADICHEIHPIYKNPINRCLCRFEWWEDLVTFCEIPMFSKAFDAQIVLEDGSMCSAFNCCSKVQ